MSGPSPSEETSPASPAASGPAGALFEGQVAAHYLLTMLAEAEPRGLPGAIIDRVELQRAGEGYPLDDVIVHGSMRNGDPVVLEIQVKRTITFAPGDQVFKDVLAQLARAYLTLDLSNSGHQFAIATERRSFKISGPYQDVLRWAREVGSASVFVERIERRKVANSDMRAFVSTIRSHFGAVGCANDDDTVWQILRRIQILVFDFDAPGSQSLELAIERSRTVLEVDEASRASGFWNALTTTAIRAASSGGDLDRARLLERVSLIDHFRVRGAGRDRRPRETLRQAAELAAADLRRDIAGGTLSRSTHLAVVREAMDAGRYIEIRGGPGVGKSGLLGMLVEQILCESSALVLSPERTIPGGWLAFKSSLGIETGPQAFLADLASDGGAVMFIDSLDFFIDPAKRATVIDLVRSAADVANIHVIVTARTDFGSEEPNWLSADVITRLGRSVRLTINDIGEEEVEELRAAVPSLRALLAEDHPARALARNLFRLSRLLEVQGAEELRSEVDLMERWWKTADGPPEGRRDRMRLLIALAENTLGGGDYIVSQASSGVIDALIASETLRDLGLDRVAFRHDVLREWAIAALLHEDPARLDGLPLTAKASPPFIRGVELAARLALERSRDGRSWEAFIDRVSPVGADKSWRRWSLLAILRSERWSALMDQVADVLLENHGAILRELIRTAMAVESRPLAEVLGEIGLGAPIIPTRIFVAANSSWVKLATWLLNRPADIPFALLPEVVQLFQGVSVSLFLRDPLTPKMALLLAHWLDEIEATRELPPYSKASEASPLVAAYGFFDLEKIAHEVRSAFALMAWRVPERAQQYLRNVRQRTRNEQTIRDILKFRGTFAQAAPAELADLTLDALIQKEADDDKRGFRRPLGRDVFTNADLDFMPSSPAQGPFLELLNAAPSVGLELIRHLVDHAIKSSSRGKDPGTNGLNIVFPTGARFFSWVQTYYWSRNTNGFYAVESGLMALEAWSHARVERGDDIDQVIADILGPQGSSAAFVLIAVDIIISHWPKTIQASMPFLACPELLSDERARQTQDSMETPDFMGLGPVGRSEPTGTVRLADLKARPSRRVPLEALLPHFLHGEGGDIAGARQRLQAAYLRLGPPEADDTFATPRFMARYALNRLDPANWHAGEGGLYYVSPPDEEQHIANLQAQALAENEDFHVDTEIQLALDKPERSGDDLAARALAYAKRLQTVATPDADEDEGYSSRRHTVVSAALIAARDGSAPLFDENEAWIRGVFSNAITDAKRDAAATRRDGIRFNPVAIAALGVIHLWRRKENARDRDTLLDLAARETTEAAPGFVDGLSEIRKLDERMVPSLLRCAIAAQIVLSFDRGTTEEEKAVARRSRQDAIAKSLAAERDWLGGSGREPAWPTLPESDIHVRSTNILAGVQQRTPRPRHSIVGEVFRSEDAARWIRTLYGPDDGNDAEWVASFVVSYASWTARANGSGLERRAEVEATRDEWNDVFYRLVASSMLRQSTESALVMARVAIDVPDRSFFDIVPELIIPIDVLYFNDRGLSQETALAIRALLAERLVDSTGWHWERQRSDQIVERQIAPAIAAFFFNNYNIFTMAKTYLLPKAIERLDPFLPTLSELIADGPVPFTAILTMNVLEVSPAPRFLEFFISSALTWLNRQPNNADLWVDSGLGSRLAVWIENIAKIDRSFESSSHPSRLQIDDILSRLVQLGVPDAHRVERVLAVLGRRD